ncbi:MAG: isochorismatase family protein [Chlamydiae bacterium]|nr:isochorismatase family protein [Chlamydiota bacterium]
MSALIIVDLQKDFMPGGALAVQEADKILPVVNNLCQEAFDCIVASKDWHPKDHVSFKTAKGGLWPVHCVQNSQGAEFCEGWDVSKIKKIFYKGTLQEKDSYSAFFNGDQKKSTGLHEFLQAQGIHKIILIGLVLEYCVASTALDGKRLGYEVVVVKEGVASLASDQEKENFFLGLQEKGVNIIKFNDISRLLCEE